jgi:signal transduction histidine kinase
LQIVVARGALLALAFLPLYFAVASLTRVTLHQARAESARALGRAVAGHVGATAPDDPQALERVLGAHVGDGGVEAMCVFGRGGVRVACAGASEEVGSLVAPSEPWGEGTRDARGERGAVLDVMVPSGDRVVVARLRTDDVVDRGAPLSRLVAGYMGVFALALLFFAYVALTRIVVRPVEAVAAAADRVASGSRRIDVPRGGPEEIAELGESVQAMGKKLLEDEATLRDKIAELERAQRKLTEAQAQVVRSERLASVGRLAAGVAHEIGNPIAALMGIEDLLLEGGLSPEEEKDFVARMKRETERIHRVLRDLLDFARPDRDAPPSAATETARVVEVATDVAALVRPQRAFRDVALEVDVGSELVARIAPARLTQVLLNLVLNAGDAMTQAGQKGTVRVDGARAEDGVRITVTDEGPGIAEPIRARLFEPFVTTKEPGEGTGLGLAVCRGLVESAGGTIELDAAWPKGARFVVTLPAG